MKSDHVHREAIQRLEVAYDLMWKKAVDLSTLIARDLPGLTLHDERHFEALWRVADIIEGPQTAFNPLEVFLFGSAILIHDLAHTVRHFREASPR